MNENEEMKVSLLRLNGRSSWRNKPNQIQSFLFENEKSWFDWLIAALLPKGTVRPFLLSLFNQPKQFNEIDCWLMKEKRKKRAAVPAENSLWMKQSLLALFLCWLWAAAAAGAPPTKEASSERERLRNGAHQRNEIKQRKLNNLILFDWLNFFGWLVAEWNGATAAASSIKTKLILFLITE